MTAFEFFSCLTLALCGLQQSVTCTRFNETLKTMITNSQLSTLPELDTFFPIKRGKFEFSLQLPTVDSEVEIHVTATNKQEIKKPYFHFSISLAEKCVKFFFNGTLDKEESFDVPANSVEKFWIDTPDNYGSIALGHDNDIILTYMFIEDIWLRRNDSLPYYSFRGNAEWQLRSNRLLLQDPDLNFGECTMMITTTQYGVTTSYKPYTEQVSVEI